MKKKLRVFCSILLAVSIIMPAAVMPVFAADEQYTAPDNTPSETYNMNLDWRFLVPSQSNTLKNALESSKDASGNYFYASEYVEDGVKGSGYNDTHGNLVEGDVWTTVSIPHAVNGLQAFAHNAIDAGERGSDRRFLLYRKEFTVPEGGSKFIFELEGIRQAAYVWVNGEEVGYYEAGIAAMGFDISKYVTPGQKAIIAIAEDGTSSRGATEYISESRPTGTLSSTNPVGAFDWKTQWGLRNGAGYQWNTVDFNESQIGLIYDAYLHVTGDVYQTFPLYNNLKTKGNYIYADNFDIKQKTATIHVDAEVRNESSDAKTVTLEVNVVDPDGNLKYTFESSPTPVAKANDAGVVYATTVKDTAYLDLGKKGTDKNGNQYTIYEAEGTTTWETVAVTEIKAQFDATDLRFWNLDDPYMYDVYTILKDEGGNAIDVQKKTTGFRKISYSIDDGLEINDRYAWLPGYAQRSTDEWAVIGSANDWMNDYDMKLLKDSNSHFIRWMHVAPKPAQVRSSDKYGVAVVVPAGDKEADAESRSWSQRMEAMRDVMIYYRNSPSVVFWESGNNAMSVDHAKEMMKAKNELDPHGMRFIGSRSLQNAAAIKESDYAGTMLGNYGSVAKAAMDSNKKWGPIMETEYNREEAPRRVWDDYSPPDYDYVNKYLGKGASKHDYYDVWDMTQEDLSLSAVKSYAGFYNSRVGGNDGNNIYSAIAMMVWSDSNMHTRNSGTENARNSGRVDPVRQIKDSYNAVRTAQSDVPAVDILGHWSYPAKSNSTYYYYETSPVSVTVRESGKDATFTYEKYDSAKKKQRDPSKKTVYVIGSEDVAKVELYRTTNGANGEDDTVELIGEATPSSAFIFEFPNTDITKGDSVTAVAYDARNNEIARDELVRTGKPASIRVTPVTSDGEDGWTADGSDIAFFDVEVLDANGNVCVLNYDKINLTFDDGSGAGVFLGGYNGGMGPDCFQNSPESEGFSFYFGGNKDKVSTLHKNYVYAENGTNRIFVKATRKTGTVKLTATLCDANGNPTSVKGDATVTSKAVTGYSGGLTKMMSSELPYTYADEAPVIESAPAMVSLSDVFDVNWSKITPYVKPDDTVYYNVYVNGSKLNLHVSAYEGLSNAVFGPILPVLDKLKELGADLRYEYDDGTNAESGGAEVPTLNVYINENATGEHVLSCNTKENILWVDGDSDLPNDMPSVKDDEFCFEYSMILKYIDGAATATEDAVTEGEGDAEDTVEHKLNITYTPPTDLKIKVTPLTEGTKAAKVNIYNNTDNNTIVYAAKYNENGALVNIAETQDNGELDFVPDKVFLWKKPMEPVKLWTRAN